MCSESRAVALQHHSLAFGRVEYFWGYGCARKGLYFNFDRDVAYFRQDWDALRPASGSCARALANLTDSGDAARVKFLCLDINLEWPWSAFDHGAVRKKLTGLEEVSFGLEKPRLDVQGEIAMLPLDEGDQWRFVRESKALGGPLAWSKVSAWLPGTVEIPKNRYIGRSGLGEGYILQTTDGA